jgi:hypothetical protein
MQIKRGTVAALLDQIALYPDRTGLFDARQERADAGVHGSGEDE